MSRHRTKLSPERLAEISRVATAPRVMMTMRCGHEAWVPDFTDPDTTDCSGCSGRMNSVGFAKETGSSSYDE
jgi:hypothetical protein